MDAALLPELDRIRRCAIDRIGTGDPDRSQPEWVRGAKSKVVLTGTGQWLMSMLPENAESTILNKLKPKRPGDTDTPDQHGELDQPAGGPAQAFADLGYGRAAGTVTRPLSRPKE